MGLAQPKTETIYTVEEYLEMERGAPAGFRHEYIDGEIYAMAGESGAHADISANLVLIIGSQLRGKDCRVRTKDTKVRSGVPQKNTFPPKGLFSYPDLVVICGAPEYHDQYKDVVTNPKLIIEVLSELTEYFDRHLKFHRYRRHNPTLTDYILVAQDVPVVEHYIRETQDESWRVWTYEGLDAKFMIDSIECEVNLAEVYDRIEFEETPESEAA
ncbi:MAG TPA: Uma2 family endonuclease [Pyrinomonadaceae bacterium]|jgi:Uma2 family endonuclease